MNSELTEKTDIKEERSLDQLGRLAASSVEPTLRPGSPTGRKRARREAAAPRADSFRGWILYDGDCPSCTASAKRFDRIFRRRGFVFLPLQTDWIMQRLSLEPGAPLEEMRVLTADGRDIGGANAVIFLARQIWWAWPSAVLARLPGIHKLLDRGYRWIAAHRGCDHIGCDIKERRRSPLLESSGPWVALIVLPFFALLIRDRVAPWQFMWLMAGAIFLGCKWLTFWRARRQIVHVRAGRALGYFFLWPGMDADKFLRRPARKNLTALSRQVLPELAGEVREPREQRFVSRAGEELSGKMPDKAARTPALPNKHAAPAIAKILLGAVLLFGVARFVPQPLLAGWIGMTGMILILHFGLFHLLAMAWRAAGVDAEPIMDAPLRSKSVSEFWGRRWNAAFNRLALDFVFRPLTRRHGTRIAVLAAFLVSGLIHEFVISLPAGAGYGLPTGYFLLQGIGILTERVLPRIRGRIFTIVITAVPAFWLFHPPFVRNVILPFMKAIGAL
jgi:predicted DCC family thiol-disulfide oxidoreductase YuxK